MLNPWEELPEQAPFVLQEDQAVMPRSYIEAAQLKLYRMPVPFIGDPRTARIVLLSLNPGWNEETDRAVTSEHSRENRRALRFEGGRGFFLLDDAFASTPGYRWWFLRLRLLIEQFGLRHVRQSLACVEWFPYCSATFKAPPETLPSQQYGFSLVEQAIERDAVIVITRSNRLWLDSVAELGEANCFSLKVPRSPYLTPANLGERGFRALVAALS